jgi:hypothetical protein
MNNPKGIRKAGGWFYQTRILQRGRAMSSMPSDLIRGKNTIVAGHTGRIVGLLKTLGVPRQMLSVRRLRDNGSFWLRRINHLQVLEQARWLYRKQIACLHPDKPGGSLKANDPAQRYLGQDSTAPQGAWPRIVVTEGGKRRRVWKGRSAFLRNQSNPQGEPHQTRNVMHVQAIHQFHAMVFHGFGADL